ncbi:LOW QUALITY PROTEIN: uncharacterized protein LOC111651958 [Xyrichtys novacula]|uniref:LOW QUALITY PROTEIN: uncharacterized protein LOC111651958 n=1 Tax=Xyrichtys novacula TaxID=13765 RepID=A0AAV1EXX8_XYRNO|nr:LOW QUALITY PROTEIN: uncharacterized protein LOC111651958 [Xyrichtys novacula]
MAAQVRWAPCKHHGMLLALQPFRGPRWPTLLGRMFMGPHFCFAVARAGRDATHPNRRCRATDNQLRRAYHASALSTRLACTDSLLLLYLEGLRQDLASEAPSDEMAEMLHVADMLLRVTSAQARALGQSMASMVQALRKVWLSQSNLSHQDYIAVVVAPVVPGEVSGLPCEVAFKQSHRTRELTGPVRDVPPSRLRWGHVSFPASSTASRATLATQDFPARGNLAHQRSFRDDRGATARLEGTDRPQSAGGRAHC